MQIKLCQNSILIMQNKVIIKNMFIQFFNGIPMYINIVSDLDSYRMIMLQKLRVSSKSLSSGN